MFAANKLKELVESNAISVHHSFELAFRAGQMKCVRSISIMDCAGRVLGISSLLRERERIGKSDFKEAVRS